MAQPVDPLCLDATGTVTATGRRFAVQVLDWLFLNDQMPTGGRSGSQFLLRRGRECGYANARGLRQRQQWASAL